MLSTDDKVQSGAGERFLGFSRPPFVGWVQDTRLLVGLHELFMGWVGAEDGAVLLLLSLVVEGHI